jgi:predicted ATPase
MKIAITGCAGLGKTLLAQLVAQRLKTSVITGTARVILEKHNYSWSHSHIESFIESRGLRQELFDLQKSSEEKAGSFVTDRAYVEQAAYLIVEGLGQRALPDEKTPIELISACKTEMMKYDVVVYLPFSVNDVADTDTMYRITVDSVIRRLLSAWIPNFMIPEYCWPVIIVNENELHDALKKNDLSQVVDWVVREIRNKLPAEKLTPQSLPKKRSLVRSSKPQARAHGQRPAVCQTKPSRSRRRTLKHGRSGSHRA